MRLHFHSTLCKLEADGAVFCGMIDLRSTCPVRVFDSLDIRDVLDISVATEKDELWLAPKSKPRRVASP